MFSRLQLIRALEGWSLEDVPDKLLLAEMLHCLPAGAMQQELARRAWQEGEENEN